MKCFSVILSVVLAVTVAASGQTTRPARRGGEADKPAAPAKRTLAVYDTVKPADLADTVAALVGEGWKQVGAAAQAELFAGDAVLINDKLAAVVRKDGSGADLYAKGQAGWTRRGRLAPLADKEELKLADVQVKAIEPSAVSVQVGLGENRGLVIGMEMEAPMVKCTAIGKVAGLRIKAPCRFGVMPDFFTDDLVADAREIKAGRAEIPIDNFLLHLLGADEAILAAVWDRTTGDVALTVGGEGAERKIVATDISFADKSSVWAAVLEEKGIWHAAELVRDDGVKGKKLDDWAVPFMAKWKGNFMREDGAVVSEPFTLKGGIGGYSGNPIRHSLDGNRERPGTYVATLAKARDLEFEAYRKAYVGYQGPMVAYPIGRLEANPKENIAGTPLDRLTVVDLMRLCLGLEPCAYVLDPEVKTMTNPGIFTCSYGKTPGMFVPVGPRAMSNRRAAEAWKEDRAFMKRETEDVLLFVKYIQDHINSYLDARLEILAYLKEAEEKFPGQAEFIGRLRTEMDKPALVFQRPVKPEVRANGVEAGTPMMAEMFKAMQIDTPEQADKAFRANQIAHMIGDPQDSRSQYLRRQVKLWRSMATMEMARNPDQSGTVEICKEIRKKTEATLRYFAGHEKDTVW